MTREKYRTAVRFKQVFRNEEEESIFELTIECEEEIERNPLPERKQHEAQRLISRIYEAMAKSAATESIKALVTKLLALLGL